ncbi:polysaccharide lyase [Streptomyces sp. NPDC058221]|uniref:polysaccharide lyase n=1 Tax=Streptomyces sp. NPDC058221 TaxID=3346388 RepID=UPI0036E7AEA0
MKTKTKAVLLAGAATGLLATLTLTPQAMAERPDAAPAAALKQNDFERPAAGNPYTLSEWAADGWDVADGFSPQGWDTRTRVDSDTPAHSGSKSLRVFYPEGQIDPQNSGALAPFSIPESREYYLSFWVKFSKDFSWGTTQFAGKVGIGLAGGKACSGGEPCTGTNGFSSRPIWSKETGKAALYYYSLEHEGEYGDDIVLQKDGADIQWPKDKWVNVVQRLKVNTVTDGQANPDGEIEVFYNGESAAKKTGLRFVTNDDQVDKAYFSSFAGGGTPEFAPANDGYIWYDDIKVSTDRADICELSSCS